ncbi:unnamed protein product [Leuciscus chuanchicus]
MLAADHLTGLENSENFQTRWRPLSGSGAKISFYAEHDYLWNPKTKLYKLRDLKTRDFQTLCQQLSDEQQVITEEDIKRKFKNLCTVFSREHSMVLKSSKSGAGAEEVYLPKWKYYYILSFLHDPCTPEESSDNLKTVLAAPSTSQFPENITSSPSTSTYTSTFTPTTPPQPQHHKAVASQVSTTILEMRCLLTRNVYSREEKVCPVAKYLNVIASLSPTGASSSASSLSSWL